MATIKGTKSNDVLTGTEFADKIDGDDGNDVIFGLGGDDEIKGGKGDDTIEGGAGNDVIKGGSGSGDNNLLDGGDGNDTIEGGKGNDTILGGDGDDEIKTKSGADFVDGGDGNDLIEGGSGDDGDTLFGGDGNDTIEGGKGDDILCGGEGNDLLDGGTGNDSLYGGPGNDTMVGGKDGDAFYVGLGGGHNEVFGEKATGGKLKANDDDDDDDILYVEGTVEVQLNGTTYTLNAGESLDVLAAIAPNDDDDDDDGIVTLADGTTVAFDQIHEIRAVDSIDDPCDTNEAPVAVDDNVSVDEDNSVLIAPLSNDSDPDGDPLSIDSFTNPSNGTLVDNGNGTFTYTPDANYNGPDSFTYTISDGNGGTDTATVNITVDPVNDDPDAVNDTANTDEDTPVVIPVLANDTDVDGDTLAIDSFTQPANGTVTDNGNGTLTYTPDANFNGTDTFTYTVSDGNGGTDTATVTVNVADDNDDPTANDDTVPTDEDTPVIFDPTANDTDPDGDPLEVLSIGDPANGTITDNGNGTFTYTPDPDFNGTDTVSYTVSDGNGGTDTATITFNVAPVNDDPDAVDDTANTSQGSPVVIPVLANDTDVDGDTLAIDSFTQPPNGTVTDNGNGTLTYTPDPAFDGTDTFTYTVSDGNGGTDTATVTVRVSDVIGPVDGLDSGEDMDPGYTDLQGDQIDGTDGDDDTIFGNGGDDTIDSGLGDDTVDGGGGDDTFEINEEGNGIDNDVIVGGETDEDDGGDTIDTSDINDDLEVVFSAPEEGTITDGTDTTEFEEIENIVLGSGDDTVTGSDGNENVDAGDGDNEMDGGDGDDTLKSGSGNDTIIGGDGSDSIEAGNGDNVVDTSGSSPRPDIDYPGLYTADIDPNDDRDYVKTGQGNDSITTGDDADTIEAGGGNDTINSGIDDDVINAGSGDDIVIAGEGNDFVLGFAGDDTIYGGLGPSFPDAINIADDGSDPIGPDLRPNNGKDTIDGGRGNDVIYGEDDDDILIGGIGADTLYGGKDDDTIDGGSGQDDIYGGQGMDSMFGGADRDKFFIDEREHAFGDTVDGGTDGNDFDTLDLTGLGKFEIVGETVDADGDSTSGTVNFLAADGVTVEGTLIFREIERLIICFTPGVAIATAKGEVAVEDLRPGDRVITRDDGVQEIRWIGRKKLTTIDLHDDPSLRPVLIRKGALGNGLPERDMMVSPNHRMLMANEHTHVLFDEREVLVAAKHLVGQPGIERASVPSTQYIHVMFDRHEVILGDGAWTESFHPGDYSLKGIEKEQRDEIFKLFPELMEATGLQNYGAARHSLKAYEAKMLREGLVL